MKMNTSNFLGCSEVLNSFEIQRVNLGFFFFALSEILFEDVAHYCLYLTSHCLISVLLSACAIKCVAT